MKYYLIEMPELAYQALPLFVKAFATGKLHHEVRYCPLLMRRKRLTSRIFLTWTHHLRVFSDCLVSAVANWRCTRVAVPVSVGDFDSN